MKISTVSVAFGITDGNAVCITNYDRNDSNISKTMKICNEAVFDEFLHILLLTVKIPIM